METTHQRPTAALRRTFSSLATKWSCMPKAVKNALTVLLYLGVGFLIYSNTFQSPFVFDDRVRIAENPAIRMEQLSFDNLWRAAFGKMSAKSRPVGNISFALNYYFHKDQLAGYHLVNIIIHVVSGILLWLFLKKTLQLKSVRSENISREGIALLGSLLWLVNPLQTQSVTYIVQRLNSMAAMFFMLAFLFYLNGRLRSETGRKWGWFLGSALAWFLALGCKQNSATLPFFIFLYEWYFFQDLSKDWLKRNLKYFLIILAVFAIIAFIFLGSKPIERLSSIADYANKQFTLTERLMTQFRVVIYYLSLIIFPSPSRLNLDYDFPLSYSLINPITTLLSLILIVGLTVLAVVLAKRQRLISFCIWWFLGNLVIESSVIPVAIIFEHRNYLPSMMVWLAPVILAYRYIKLDWLKIGLLILPVVVFSIWTYQRNQIWTSELSFWEDCVKKSPSKARSHLNYGKSFSNLGKTAEAIEQYAEALRINPKSAKAHFNLGNAMLKQGKTDEAIRHFSKASQLDSGFSEAYNNLGMVLVKEGRIDAAIQQYRRALSIRPEFTQAHLNLGVALVEQGKFAQAVTHFEQALKIDPTYSDAQYNLAGVLEKQGKINEAIDHYLAALEKNPDNEEAHFNLANIFFKQRKLDDAVAHYKAALAIRPDFVQAINNLALLHAAQKDYAAALTLFLEALKHRPDGDAQTLYNIACMYAHLNKIDESIDWLTKAVDKGYAKWDRIKTDSDLENIRKSSSYQKLVRGH